MQICAFCYDIEIQFPRERTVELSHATDRIIPIYLDSFHKTYCQEQWFRGPQAPPAPPATTPLVQTYTLTYKAMPVISGDFR